jgi:uncharacterized OB-fold protein/acyl dehydratase
MSDPTAAAMTPEELRARLDAVCGREGEPDLARDPVNLPMIRHWCDAVGDRNPCYTDPAFAANSVHGGIVAPPTMLQAWIMPGLRPPTEPAFRRGPVGQVLRLLDEAGYTSVVATDCRQDYHRYLVPGDRLTVTSLVAGVSDEKRTALGPGRFVDQVMVYRDRAGCEVARMTFRILKFAPARAAARPAPATRAQARRPRPARSPDTAFFWEGVLAGKLLIQRCAACARLRHPPGPMCPGCLSLEWDTRTASGRGRVYSFVVAHHPEVPPFAYPNLIVLVELEEGTRLVSNLVGIDPAEVEIGMPVEVQFTRVDDDLVLPLFRPAAAPRAGDPMTPR